MMIARNMWPRPSLRLNLVLAAVLALLSLWPVGARDARQGIPARPLVPREFAALPLPFIPNLGQAAAGVRFLAGGAGRLAFGIAGVELPSGVHLRFENANPAHTVEGSGALPGVANYYLGRDPAAWRTGVPTFVGVAYRQLYPGIDLDYALTDGRLKGTYTVAPGADPAAIRWRYDGAAGVRTDPASGDLLIAAPGEQSAAAPVSAAIVERAPVAWQVIDGRRVPVDAGYELIAAGGRPAGAPLIGFALGKYDKGRPLVIDPTVVFSTYLGGSSADVARGVAVDSAGDIIVAGETASGDFPGAGNANAGGYDAFIIKLNSAGNAILFSTYLGGSGDDRARDVALDGNGAAYITGSTTSPNFPTLHAVQPALSGPTDTDMFVAKLSAAGALVYSTYLGGPGGFQVGNAIAVDGQGSSYVAGNLGGDVRVTKLTPSGDALAYDVFFGGSNDDVGLAIAVDGSGQAYVAGETHSKDFPTANALFATCDRAPNTTVDCGVDGFVAELNAAGNALVFSTFLGGSAGDNVNGIALDGAGGIYVTGRTNSQDFPATPGAYKTACSVFNGLCWDPFVVKLSGEGAHLDYATYLGGGKFDSGNRIVADAQGNAYVAGVTESADFPMVGATQPQFAGGLCGAATRFCYDGFVSKLNPAGSNLLFGTFIGGSDDDEYAFALALDRTGGLVVVGKTKSVDFPTVSPLQPRLGPSEDGFVIRIAGAGGPVPHPDYPHHTFLPLSMR